MFSISAKYEVWKILLRENPSFYLTLTLLTFSNLNLVAGFYEHFNI